jgi:hypothetical protein
MGQYYKPIVLNDVIQGEPEKVKAWVYSHEIKTTYTRDDGSKFTMGSGLKLMEHSWMKNPFVKAFETLIVDNPQRVVWAGDYADEETDQTCVTDRGTIENVNLYSLCDDSTKVKPNRGRKLHRYVINHTRKEFVDKSSCPEDSDGWQIHPLPLLTCEGNGRGGGDFRGSNDYVGLWARDVISVGNSVPDGFEEIKPDFAE